VAIEAGGGALRRWGFVTSGSSIQPANASSSWCSALSCRIVRGFGAGRGLRRSYGNPEHLTTARSAQLGTGEHRRSEPMRCCSNWIDPVSVSPARLDQSAGSGITDIRVQRFLSVMGATHLPPPAFQRPRCRNLGWLSPSYKPATASGASAACSLPSTAARAPSISPSRMTKPRTAPSPPCAKPPRPSPST